MTVFDESAYKAALTPWGTEVKKRLLDRESERKPPYTQDEVVAYLSDKGFNVNKKVFSAWLRGVGVTTRKAEIAAINELLGILSA
ncbi:MAG: hypothetical protein FWE19_00350 [Oscillospiraceae bacterium]|nr:hypothetical protein [Oscillospiraceae bacterium]